MDYQRGNKGHGEQMRAQCTRAAQQRTAGQGVYVNGGNEPAASRLLQPAGRALVGASNGAQDVQSASVIATCAQRAPAPLGGRKLPMCVCKCVLKLGDGSGVAQEGRGARCAWGTLFLARAHAKLLGSLAYGACCGRLVWGLGLRGGD